MQAVQVKINQKMAFENTTDSGNETKAARIVFHTKDLNLWYGADHAPLLVHLDVESLLI